MAHHYEVKYGAGGNCGWVVEANSETEAINKFRTQNDQGKRGEPVAKVRKID